MLDPNKAAEAKRLYDEFFAAYRQPNPTDLNTLEKYEYAFEIGFEGYVLMQQARKESCDFSLYSTWVTEQNRQAAEAHAAARKALV